MRVLSLDDAVAALARGEIVALPTDTVYGVGAAISHPLAVAALFALKHRPSSVALPVVTASIDQITDLGVEWTGDAKRLSDRFWPGALTIIVAAPIDLAHVVGASDTVGFRIPDDEVLRALLARSGPLALTSANAHGEPPCVNATQLAVVFGDDRALAGVLDAGERSGQVSTVVDISSDGSWRVVREGAVSTHQLDQVLHGR